MGEHGTFLTTLLLMLAAGLIFWPQWGVFWRWQRVSRMAERTLIEDALKHLYNFEYRRQVATVESLAGAFDRKSKRKEFRRELEILQSELRNYNSLLADIAGVEDLTDLERTAPE